MNIEVTQDNQLRWNGQQVPCAIGRGGRIAEADKREGDGATPIGSYLLRRVYYRPDKGPRPTTNLPVRPILPDDGWCDAPGDLAYNRLIKLPYPASAEKLWRDDELYNVFVEVSHNDAPVVAGLGSAIFLHCAKPDFSPTEGCVAIAEEKLRSLLADAAPGDTLTIF